MGSVLFTVLILFVVLGVLVFVHELGHYWAAKAFGVWVHRFAVGMGPPVKRLSFRRGETEWAIAWLPLGGYVKMASRDEDPSSSVLEGGAENAVVPPDRVFEAKPVWQRMIIILAGVTMNIVLAWLLYTGLALANGNQYDPTTRIGMVEQTLLPEEARALADLEPGTEITAINGVAIGSWDDVLAAVVNGPGDSLAFAFARRDTIVVRLYRDQLIERANLAAALRPFHAAVIAEVAPGSPADRAGFEPGDSLVAIDGVPVRQFADAVAAIEPAAGRELVVTVMRDGATHELRVTPDSARDEADAATNAVVGRIWVVPRVPYRHEPYSLGGAIAAGAEATWNSAGMIFRTVHGLVTRRVPASEVGGPILVGQLAARQAEAGASAFLAFMALISVNLALVNLLPIPVLDGGAFLMLAVEAIIRRPIPVRLREAVQVIGLVMVVLLMVLAFSNDIARLLGR